jgi:hypothetical protein
MALDISGSMEAPASDTDKVPKIKALHRAAARFVKSMSTTAQTTLLPFGSEVAVPMPFSNNKVDLTQSIKNLTTSGETALFDAVYAAIMTLEAERPKGKRVVVAMTDGIDNTSRRRVEEVIERAKEAKVPLYLLGFGRQGELDTAVMTRMASETGGKFFHAKDEKSLIEIFEKLSMEIHDDGIDEKALKEISDGTGGKYYSAKDVSKLDFILAKVSEDIEKEKSEIFLSRRQVHDGLPRKVSLIPGALPRGTLAKIASNPGGSGVAAFESTGKAEAGSVSVHGLVIAEMNHFTYLFLAAILGALLVVPAAMKSKSRNGKS